MSISAVSCNCFVSPSRKVYDVTLNDSVFRLTEMLPDSGAADEIAMTLLRLQSMYNMTEADISSGEIRGHRYEASPTQQIRRIQLLVQ